MNELIPALRHNQFVTIVQMTVDPEMINYQFFKSILGEALIASTPIGVCYLAFCPDKAQALAELRKMFPDAELKIRSDKHQEAAKASFLKDVEHPPMVILHLKGTPFQYKVWNALLGSVKATHTTYSALAGALGNPGAVRAVGSAVGRNPVAYLIPCHRVRRVDGLGDYRWGVEMKAAIIEWERQVVTESIQKAFANRHRP